MESGGRLVKQVNILIKMKIRKSLNIGIIKPERVPKRKEEDI